MLTASWNGMTLSLAVATPAYSLHVSDRLVSRGGMPVDPLANKTVVFRATDGMLSFAYTGPAFIRGASTDAWLARLLSGDANAGRNGAIAYGDFPVRDVGSSLLELCSALRANARFQRLGGEVSAVGWQWPKRKEGPSPVRHVLWVLHSGSGALRGEQLVPRHIPERKTTFRMVWTGDWPLGRGEWQHLLDQVGRAGHDWRHVETLLVTAIREASSVRPGTIGPHCMSVLLRPWRSPHVEVRFMPETAHLAHALGQTVEVAYSPWLVAPDAIHAPSVMVGGLSCDQGMLTYSMAAPDPAAEQRLKGLFTAQSVRR